MTNPLGYVVLARRPNPYKQDPWDYTTVSLRSFDTPEAAMGDPALSQLKTSEALQWLLDHDAERHFHHRECIHNLSPEEQIAMRGRTVERWTNIGAAWPKQIEPGHWEVEPTPDPVEYIVRQISEWSGR